jgi:hypothetical protein
MPSGSAARLGFRFLRPAPVDFTIEWETAQTNILSQCGPGGWSITDNGRTVRFSFQNSANCGGCNPLRQSGVATASIYTGSNNYQFQPVLQGRGEQQDSNFDTMNLYLDGALITQARAPGGRLGCAVAAPAVIIPPVPPMFTLTKFRTYEFELRADTNDPLFHVNAYYEAVLNFFVL